MSSLRFFENSPSELKIKSTPKLILTKIFLCLAGFQSVYLATASALTLILHLRFPIVNEELYTAPLHPLPFISFLLATTILGLAIKNVVEKARHVLDFVLTVHLLVILQTFVVTGVVTSWWWFLQIVVSVAAGTLIGEFLVRKEESRQIFY